MKARIYSHSKLIGTADLQIGDPAMGCVFGTFIPNDTYFSDIQKNVWGFWTADKPDFIKWHSLHLNVQLDNGYFLSPAGGYTIDDHPGFPEEPKRIDIAGLDYQVLVDFFQQDR
jgi:hypothetical protein